LVSPGTWLADLCPDRYDVRVKKSSKKVWPFYQFHSSDPSIVIEIVFALLFVRDMKMMMVCVVFVLQRRARGLKAMGNMETDSDWQVLRLVY
jgi:hypothetical protein